MLEGSGTIDFLESLCSVQASTTCGINASVGAGGGKACVGPGGRRRVRRRDVAIIIGDVRVSRFRKFHELTQLLQDWCERAPHHAELAYVPHHRPSCSGNLFGRICICLTSSTSVVPPQNYTKGVAPTQWFSLLLKGT